MRQVRIAVPIILAGLSILIAMSQVLRLWSQITLSPQEEMVTTWDARVEPLRSALPKGLDRAGYLDAADILSAGRFDIEEFLLMQYSVAPVALERGLIAPWTICNVSGNVDLEAWLDERVENYELQSFGFGLYLVHVIEQ